MKKLVAVILLLALIMPAAALGDDSIAGKWSFFWDKRYVNDKSDVIFINMDLILLENHFAFLITSSIPKDKLNFVIDEPPAKGTWMPDEGNEGYIFYINNAYPPVQYPMELDANGRLVLKFSDSAVYPFVKTQSYEGVVQ